jgi:hypothetical protein
MSEMANDTQETHSKVICGHGLVPAAHGGRLFLRGSAFVALKIENVVDSMLKTMRLQEKLMPRINILAYRTRIFCLCSMLE